MYAPTAAGATLLRPERARAKISRISPVVATTLPSHRWPAARSLVENSTAGTANMRLARMDPAIAPRIWAAMYPPRWVGGEGVGAGAAAEVPVSRRHHRVEMGAGDRPEGEDEPAQR